MGTREIKFRAWFTDGESKVMSGQKCSGQEDRSLETFFADIEDVKAEHGYDCTLMQYTGLKDKLGKEIYEGDIVRELTALITGDGFAPLSGKHPVFEVKYCIGRKDRLVNPLYGDVGYNISSGSCYEVIGNIYESPELLKESENG